MNLYFARQFLLSMIVLLAVSVPLFASDASDDIAQIIGDAALSGDPAVIARRLDQHLDIDVAVLANGVRSKNFNETQITQLTLKYRVFAAKLLAAADQTKLQVMQRFILSDFRPKDHRYYCATHHLAVSKMALSLSKKRRELLGTKLALLEKNIDFLEAQNRQLRNPSADLGWLLREGPDGIWNRITQAARAEMAMTDRTELIADIDREIIRLESEHAKASALKEAEGDCVTRTYAFFGEDDAKVGLLLTILEKGPYLKLINIEVFSLGISIPTMVGNFKRAGDDFDAAQRVFNIETYRQ